MEGEVQPRVKVSLNPSDSTESKDSVLSRSCCILRIDQITNMQEEREVDIRHEPAMRPAFSVC